MTTAPPPVTESTTDARCHNCGRWEAEEDAIIGYCLLGPNPRRAFQKGVVLRQTAPDQTCSGFEEAYAARLLRAGERWR